MGFRSAEPSPLRTKKPEVVLQAVRRADDGVVQAVRVEVLERLAHALLEVRRRDDLQVGRGARAAG
jgi:hypothetical protein